MQNTTLPNRIFNRGVYMPPSLIECAIERANSLHIEFSSHFRHSYTERAKRNNMEGFKSLLIDRIRSLSPSEIVEAEYGCGRLQKFVARIPLSNTDACIPLQIKPDCLLVKTVWFNSKNDTHSTIDTSKYSQMTIDILTK